MRRAEGLALLTQPVRRAPDDPLRVLDVGTGQGLLASLFLDRFPHAVAIGSDPPRAITWETAAVRRHLSRARA